MRKFKFDAMLFFALPKFLHCRFLSTFLRPLDIRPNRWNHWMSASTLPMTEFAKICQHYRIDPSSFITDSDDNRDVKRLTDPRTTITFRNLVFSDAITKLSGMGIAEACRHLGNISTATFYNCVRPSGNSKPSINVCDYLEWCETMDRNPLDYLHAGQITVAMNY